MNIKTLFKRFEKALDDFWHTYMNPIHLRLLMSKKTAQSTFGYPPDMQKLATETVLRQAELIANEITRY